MEDQAKIGMKLGQSNEIRSVMENLAKVVDQVGRERYAYGGERR